MIHRVGLRVAAATAAAGAALGGSLLRLDVEDENAEILYRRVVMPALKMLDPERAHRVGVLAGRVGLLPQQKRSDPGVLQTRLWGRVLENPIGLAAGFDKDGEAIGGMLSLGFGMVEVGSVTPLPQPGNPKPRVFRLEEDRAVINRYGFNSRGHEYVRGRLSAAAASIPRGKLLGVNLGMNKTSDDAAADYCAGVRALGRYAGYLVVNVSSPNTPGLRDLQQREKLSELLRAVRAEVDALPQPRPPLVLKMSPDVDAAGRRDIASVALAERVDGIIVSNTTVSRPLAPLVLKMPPDLGAAERIDVAVVGLPERPDGIIVSNVTVSPPIALKSTIQCEAGGLSGAPLMDLSTETLRDMYRLTKGRITLIGAGGVGSGADAYAKLRAGASAVQLYTALVFEGPTVVAR